MHPPVADLLFFLRFFELNAMWVFQFLEWTESLPWHAWPPRANFAGTDGEGPARTHGRTGNRRHDTTAQLYHHNPPPTQLPPRHHEAWVSHHFPGFNIRRLWRLSGSFLKQVLEELARSLIHILASSAGYG